MTSDFSPAESGEGDESQQGAEAVANQEDAVDDDISAQHVGLPHQEVDGQHHGAHRGAQVQADVTLTLRQITTHTWEERQRQREREVADVCVSCLDFNTVLWFHRHYKCVQ